MRLYLMRHGVAEDRRPDLPDADRALTEKGHRKLAAQADALRALGWKADVLLTSPYTRAVETAAYVSSALERPADPVGALASGADPDSYLAVLAVQPPEAHVWIVSHEPDLSDTIRVLTGGHVRMRKGTIAVLDVTVPAVAGAVLRGLYDPGAMASLVAPPADAPAATTEAPPAASAPVPPAPTPGRRAPKRTPAAPKADPASAPEAAAPPAEEAPRSSSSRPLLDMPATKGLRRAKHR